MSGKRLLVLYLAVPLLFALFNGLRGSIWIPDIGPVKTFLMFAACSLPLWLLSAGLAHALLPVVQKIGWRPVIALVVTLITSVPLSYGIVLLFIIVFGKSFPGLENALDPSGRALVDGFWGYVSSPTGLIFVPVWTVAQWLYEAVTGEVLFFHGYMKGRKISDQAAPISTVIASQSEPEFTKKLSPELGCRILALEAQEHYVKVHTELGQELIHYRFGDAVQELASRPGLQVHRSYWVAEDAVVSVVPVGKSFQITLCNGLTVPVSLSYRGAVQQHRIAAAAHN